MSTIILDECTYNLYEAERLYNSIVELDAYTEIFEADNPEVQKQMADNEKKKTGVFEHLKKAAQAVLNSIMALVNKVRDFFQSKKMDEAEKQAYLDFKAAVKADPSLKNKTVTVADFRKLQEEYLYTIRAIEDQEKAIAAGKETDCDRVIAKAKDYIANAGKGVFFAVGAEGALKLCKNHKGVAKVASEILKNDADMQQELVNALGKKEAKRFAKDVNSLGKLISVKKFKMQVTQKFVDLTTKYSAKNIAAVGAIGKAKKKVATVANAAGMAAKTSDVRKRLKGNEQIGGVVKDIEYGIKKGNKQVETASKKLANKEKEGKKTLKTIKKEKKKALNKEKRKEAINNLRDQFMI